MDTTEMVTILADKIAEKVSPKISEMLYPVIKQEIIKATGIISGVILIVLGIGALVGKGGETIGKKF